MFFSSPIGDFEKTVFPPTCTKSQLKNVLNGVSSFLQKNDVKKEEPCSVTVRSSQKCRIEAKLFQKALSLLQCIHYLMKIASPTIIAALKIY